MKPQVNAAEILATRMPLLPLPRWSEAALALAEQEAISEGDPLVKYVVITQVALILALEEHRDEVKDQLPSAPEVIIALTGLGYTIIDEVIAGERLVRIVTEAEFLDYDRFIRANNPVEIVNEEPGDKTADNWRPIGRDS